MPLGRESMLTVLIVMVFGSLLRYWALSQIPYRQSERNSGSVGNCRFFSQKPSYLTTDYVNVAKGSASLIFLRRIWHIGQMQRPNESDNTPKSIYLSTKSWCVATFSVMRRLSQTGNWRTGTRGHEETGEIRMLLHYSCSIASFPWFCENAFPVSSYLKQQAI